MKTALIIGARGQDGRYLTRMLLRQGYRVIGAIRPGSGEVRSPIVNLAWPSAVAEMREVLAAVRPDEIYNFAGRTSGAGMFDDAVAIGEENGLAVARLLEAIRRTDPAMRFVQASSSEMFGRPAMSPQSEASPFTPRSPYGAAKLYAHAMIDVYRKQYGMFAVSAILYNHESRLRSPEFVTRKVTMAAAAAASGDLVPLVLGDLNARRDWGFAGDTVDAMWRVLQANEPLDYVVATGITHSVGQLCQIAYESVGLDWRQFVRSDPNTARSPAPVELVGDASRLRECTGWSPTMTFEQMIGDMVRHDHRSLTRPELREFNFDEL